MTQLATQEVGKMISSPAVELLFVNADVPESEILLDGLAPTVEVIQLPCDGNGIAHITSALAGRRQIVALHVLGHGANGRIEFGGTTLSLDNLQAVEADLAFWRQSLTDDADIMLYGCNVSAAAEGVALVERLAELTGANVAASASATGAANLGGNWTLETQTGRLTTSLPFSAEARSAWPHTLNHFRYGTMSWEPVPGSPNSVIIKGQVDWTNTHGWIPPSTPIGGIVPGRLTLDFGDGTTQSVAVRVLARDAVTNDVLTEFVSDLDGNGIIDANEVGVRHDYTTTGNYNVSWNGSAREAARDQSSTTWQQDMRIDLGVGNSAPVVATPAVVQVVDDTTFTYQIAATDPNGDTLRFRYGTQDEFYKNGVMTEATRPTGLTLTPGGLITWDVHNSVLNTVTGDRWQTTIMAEDLDASGNVKSFVPVDFVLQIVAAGSQPPTFTQLPTGPQVATSGHTSTFTVEMDDPDSTTAPTVTVLNPPSADPAIFSTTSSTSPDGKTTLTISFTPTQNLEGNSYVVNVRGRDSTGLTSDQSITLTVPDTTPPAIPTLALDAASDTGSSGSDFITSDTIPTLTGTAEAGSTITLTDNGSGSAIVLGTTTANGSGLWSFTPGTPLTDGAHSVTATATDSAGNISLASTVLSLLIDTLAPTAPGSLALASASDSGILGDGITSSTIPTLTGTGEAGSIVTFTDTSSGTAVVLGTTIVDGSGRWDFTPAAALVEGVHSITATAADIAGNASAFLSPFALTIDNSGPSAPSIPGLASGSDSGTVGDDITRDTTPTLTGTAEAGSSVTLTDTRNGIPVVLGTALADSSGQWSFTPTDVLIDGTHDITTRATDAAGNTSPASGALSLSIDSAQPAVPASLVLALTSDSGIPGDRITNVTTPTLSGVAQAGSTITLTDTSNGTAVVLGTASTNGNGRWSFTPETILPAGDHSVTATATDVAGNTSAASDALLFSIDIETTVPGSVALAPTSDSGTLGDGITNVAVPTLTGTADAGSTITVTDTSGGTAVVLGTTVVDGSGVWRFTPTTALANGVHSVTAAASDLAGNVSAASVPFVLVIDNTLPAAPGGLILAPASDSGTLGDGITNDPAPTLTGTADPGSTITLTNTASGIPIVIGTSVADGVGHWSFTPGSILADGTYSITATATDAAGNVSLTSSAFALTIDAGTPEAPEFVTLAPASDSGNPGDNITNVTKPTLTGSADEAGATVTITDISNGVQVVLGTTQVNGNGGWSFTPETALSSGAHSFAATIADAAGNVSAPTVLALTLDTAAPATPGNFTLAPPSDSGTLGDNLTNNIMPTLTGTGEAGSTITLTDNSSGTPVVLGTVFADTEGQWSFTSPTALSEGAHSIIATATDAAGNTSLATPALSLAIDATAPTAPTGLALTSASNSGSLADTITNVAIPTLTGIAEVGSTITLTDSSGSGPSVVLGTALVDGSGRWRFTPTAPLLDGPHSVTVTATDGAGNISPTSAFPLTINTTVPAATYYLALAPRSDSGKRGDNLTNIKRPTINGTGQNGNVVTLLAGTTPIGTATVSTSGRWSITATAALSEGANIITAIQTNAAATASGVSSPLTINIDTQVPPAPSSLMLDPASDTGVSNSDRVTDVALPTITGTGENGSTITLFDGDTVIGSGTVSSGAWAITATTALREGANTITATQTDIAGNVSSPSSTLNVTLVPARFAILDTTTNVSTTSAGDAYTGPVTGLQYQYGAITQDSLNITALVPNVFIHGGSGTDGLNVSQVNGNNILDGGAGSSFLIGGTGNDTFYMDNRNMPTTPIFSTIMNFHSGDDATLWGVNATDFTMLALDDEGADGSTGLDLIFSAPGHIDTSFVLSGYTSADLTNGRLSQSFSTTPDLPGLPGSQYMTIHAN